MTASDDSGLQAFRARLAGTNINAESLLATDYLNHFNEAVMMLDLIADMPEMLDEIKAWKPLGYCDHFRNSQFAERDLAIEAYGVLPAARREPFEDAVAQTHARIAKGIVELDTIIAAGIAAGGDAGRLRNQTTEIGRDLHQLIDRLNAIIHGGVVALDQPDIDGMFSVDAKPASGQSDIDALFD